MKKHLLLICTLCFVFNIEAQNLVPNPSFENYNNCPQGPGALDGNVQWWSTPDTATPDYYNTCYTPLPPPFPAGPSMNIPSNIQGFQQAKTGNGYAGIISGEVTLGINTNYREYIQIELNEPLVAGNEYCVEFFWSLADASPHYVEEIGVYFSPSQVFLQQSTALPFTPQLEQSGTPLNDTANWVAFQQNYIASGNELFMIIGNFRPPASTTLGNTGVDCDIITGGCFAYYYIEDVKVEAGQCCLKYITPVEAICLDDSPFNFEAQTSGGTWSSIPASPALNSSSGQFTPNLASVANYSIIYTLPCGSDTIEVNVNDCSALNVCVENNGDLTVSGGTGPYTWEYFQASTSITINNQTDCDACGYEWNAFVGECFNPFPIPATSCTTLDSWISFDNGSTITSPSSFDTIRVVDNAGTIYTIFDIDTVSPCNDLCINPVFATDNQAACDSYVWIDGNTYNSSTNTPTFTITEGASNGCDSIVTLNLSVNTSDSTFSNSLSCNPIDTGFFIFNLINQNSCDSIHTERVDLVSSNTISSSENLCSGDTLIWNGQIITTGGTYFHSTSSTDSIFPKINNNTPQPLGTTGPSYTSYGFSTPALYSDYGPGGAALPDGSPNGFTYEYLTNPFWTGNGVVADRITSILGRWITGPYNTNTWYGGSATISIPTTQTYYVLLSADNEFRFSLNGNIVISSDGNAILATQPGGTADQVAFRRAHIYPLEIPAGCHVITLEALDYGGAAMLAGAILNNTELELINATSINDLNFVFSTQDEANFYSGSPNYSCPVGSIELGSSNCDSCQILICGDVFELNVNELLSGSSIDTVNTCNSFTWIDGVTYNTSTNTPTFTIPDGAENGCDSIITLNLTINPIQSSIDIQNACESFTWIDGNTYTLSTDTPTFIIIGGTENGCDSVVTLNLTISNTPQNSIDEQIACNSYTWIDGNTYTSSTNTPTFTIDGGAENGCDSIVTLNLTLNTSDSTFSTTSSCNPIDTGIVSTTFINQNGCDSVHIVNTEFLATNYAINQNYAIVNGGESFDFTIINEDENLEFSWFGSNGELCDLPCDNYTVNPNDFSVIYYFTLTDTASNCFSNDTMRIDVEYSSELNIPNIFTPNNDGENDIYRVYGKDIFEYSLMIFDRWGGKLFETNDLTEGWNGTFKEQPVASGVYIGLIKATGIDGKKYEQDVNIRLVR